MFHRLLLSLALIVLSVYAENCVVPTNDKCVDARPLKANTAIDGDNSCANFDYNNQGQCGSRSDRNAVWYRLTGKGKEVTVKVCTNNDEIADYGIFTECNSINNAHCVGFTRQQTEIASCALNQTLDLTFTAQEDQWYYVHVRSGELGDPIGVGSVFTIIYEEEGGDKDDDQSSDDDSAMGVSTVMALFFSALAAMTWV